MEALSIVVIIPHNQNQSLPPSSHLTSKLQMTCRAAFQEEVCMQSLFQYQFRH